MQQKTLKQAPDGGWGYVVAAAMTVILSVTITPLAAFGLVYGNFLRGLGDETNGITVTTGTFNVLSSCSGLLAAGLLNRLSVRKVALLGAALFSVGVIGDVFVQKLFHLVLFFGFQGFGFGLIIPATMTAFNSYFDKKQNVVMSATQAINAAFCICMAPLAIWSLHTFGFRGTVAGVAAMGLLSLPAAATFKPVNDDRTPDRGEVKDPEASFPLKDVTEQHQKRLHNTAVSMGSRVASVATLEEVPKKTFLELSLLKEPKYLNVSLGIGLVIVTDFSFTSIIPMVLGNKGFTAEDIASMMATFFGCDLASRILLTLVSFRVTYSNRILFLVGSGLSGATRIVMMFRDGYAWKLGMMGLLGFLRCFVLTPLPLVLTEEFPDRFSSAFSLSMAVNGVVTIVMSFLMSAIKQSTGSDDLLCHLLSLANIICAVSWTIELICTKRKIVHKEDANNT